MSGRHCPRKGIITDAMIRRAAERRGLGITVETTARDFNVPAVGLRKAVNAFMQALNTVKPDDQ